MSVGAVSNNQAGAAPATVSRSAGADGMTADSAGKPTGQTIAGNDASGFGPSVIVSVSSEAVAEQSGQAQAGARDYIAEAKSMVIDPELAKELAELKKASPREYLGKVISLYREQHFQAIRERFGEAMLADISKPVSAAESSARMASDPEYKAAVSFSRSLSDAFINQYDAAVEPFLVAERKVLAQQGRLETTLAEAGAPQKLIDAVREVKILTSHVGGYSGSVSTLARFDELDLSTLRKHHGEEGVEAFRRTTKSHGDNSKQGIAIYSSRISSQYDVEGALTKTGADGLPEMGDFILSNIGDGYALKYDAATRLIALFKDGADITAHIYDGTYFGKKSSDGAKI